MLRGRQFDNITAFLLCTMQVSRPVSAAISKPNAATTAGANSDNQQESSAEDGVDPATEEVVDANETTEAGAEISE